MVFTNLSLKQILVGVSGAIVIVLVLAFSFSADLQTIFDSAMVVFYLVCVAVLVVFFYFLAIYIPEIVNK